MAIIHGMMPKSEPQLRRQHRLNVTQQNHSTLQMIIKFDFNILRDSRYSLRVMQTLPEMKLATSKPTQLEVRTPMKLKMDVASCKLIILATAVAVSDSFGNCHKCQGYLNCISNDDRNAL